MGKKLLAHLPGGEKTALWTQEKDKKESQGRRWEKSSSPLRKEKRKSERKRNANGERTPAQKNQG